jgi:hypothetical protein
MLRIPKKIVNYTTYIFLIISLSSCFQSKVPLTEANAAVVDERLWYGENEENEVYSHVIPQKPPFMMVVKVVHPRKGWKNFRYLQHLQQGKNLSISDI